MDILDDMGVSKLSAKVFSKVNYSFKTIFLVNVQTNMQGFLLDHKMKRQTGTRTNNSGILVLFFTGKVYVGHEGRISTK